MNRVDTICPWCFEVQDTGMVRKMTRASQYMQQDENDPDKWEEINSGSLETCKNCGKEYAWRLTTRVVAETTRLDWALRPSATAMTPKVVGLMPHELVVKGDKDAES